MRVAVIGLGIMGSGIARRLAERGHTVAGYNRTLERAKALQQFGVIAAATPREATAGADAVILMLSDDAATRACTDGPDGVFAALQAGALVLQMGTLHPDTTLALADEARRHDAELLDAPVSGSAHEAANGLLWVLAGGSVELLERARPVLDDIAQNVYRAGDVGMGARIKLCNNMMSANIVAALAEAMTLVSACDLDPALFVQILSETNVGTRLLAGKGKLMVDGDYAARFSVANLRKDVGLALSLADDYGLHLVQTTNVQRVFDEAIRLGHGNDDVAALRTLPEP